MRLNIMLGIASSAILGVVMLSFVNGTVGSAQALAAEATQDAKSPMAAEHMPSNEASKNAATSSEEVDNKICPVSGEKIPTGKAYKIEYNGKTYSLCCSMCEKDFKKDPAKYIEKIANEPK